MTATGQEDRRVKCCSKCGIAKPLLEFYAATTRDGHAAHCKSCHRNGVRAWRAKNPERVRAINAAAHSDRGKVAEHNRRYRERHYDRILEGQRRWRQEDRRRDRAHNAVNKRIRRGELIRPTTCSKCGGGGRIEASHHDYDKPLDITWLCTRCHRRLDHERRKEAAS